MAPLAQSISSLLQRSAMPLDTIASLVKRTSLSPLHLANLHRRADDNDNGNTNYHPGQGAKKPDAFNRDLFLVIFAIIAAGMVCTSIYFFFVAKNGGFVWKENDWDDYKTTVLRRKGPDGKTLSNATKSTKLGGGSVVPKWDDRYTDVSSSTMSDLEAAKVKRAGRAREHYRDNKEDPVFNSYAHEKVATVGGYNKPHEGSHYTGSNTEPSVTSGAQQKISKKEKKEQERREKEARKQAAKEEKESRKKGNKSNDQHVPQHQDPPAAPAHRAPASTTSYGGFSQDGSSYTTPGSHVYGAPQPSPSAANSYYTNYRPGAPTMRAVPEERLSSRSSPSGSHRHGGTGGHVQRQSSPRKQHRESQHGEPLSSSSHSGSSSEVGTKVYPCHIPGISKSQPEPAPPSLFAGREEVRPDESVSQIGVQQQPRRYGGGGFRRGRPGF